MGRPRKKQSSLPPCVFSKHGAYWYVKKGKWTRLGDDLRTALRMYADLVSAGAEQVAKSGRLMMPELIALAMPGILRGKAENTVKQYNAAAEKLKDKFAEFEPREVLPRHIAECMDGWADTPNVANRRLSVLKQVFRYALRHGHADLNPCVGQERHAEAKRTRYITHDEYRVMWQHGSPDFRVMLDLLYLTGQRIEDVLSIEHRDVTPEGVYVTTEKVDKKLLISMTPDLRRVLDEAAALPRKNRGSTVLCTVRGGRKYAYKTGYDMYKLAAEKAGVLDTKPHDIRAKAITDAKAQGLDPQALGGHSTMQMTLRYIRQYETTVAQSPKSIRQPASIGQRA